jgi:pimeloyl-ACP methyl ester carboxylesterase
LVTLAAGYVALAAAVFLVQRSMLFPVPSSTLQPRLAGGRIEQSDGSLALYVPALGDAPTVVHFHGNGQQLADTAWLGDELHRGTGLGFYSVEYPGYGLLKAAGEPTEAAIYASAERALRHLESKLGVPRTMMVLQGQSLGTGVAVEMARRGYGQKLVLVSPYTSIIDMGAIAFSFLPARLLTRDPFETVAKAGEVSVPVLIVHGTKDEVIPVEMGRRLSTVFRQAELELVEGMGHNDVLTSKVVERIRDFASAPQLKE